MYQEFFSFEQLPFSIAPNPEFLFFTEQHKEALAHLSYGLQGSGGFGVLTGEVGTGKTSVCQFLLRELPENTDIASVTNSDVSQIELLIDICGQFAIDYDAQNITLKVMFDALSEWMLANHERGRHALVFIDDAQQLSFEVLEMLRLITNIEADNIKPLQIILIGQTALQKKLLTKELRQLSQRITARYHLNNLSKQEGSDYIQHRLGKAGDKGGIFDAKATSIIAKAGAGNPRVINQICDRCLLTAYNQSKKNVTSAIAKKVIRETEFPKANIPLSRYVPYCIALIAVLLSVFLYNKQAPAIATDLVKSKAAQPTQPAQPNVVKQPEQQDVIEIVDKVAAPVIAATATKKTKPQAAEKAQKAAPPRWSLTPISTLLAIPENNYSLQLTTLANKNLVKNFFTAYPLLQEKSYLYRRVIAQRSRYVILLGNFESYAAAKQASEELINEFPDIEPWIKEYRTIQHDIQ